MTLRPALSTDAAALADLIIMAMTPPCCLHFVGAGRTLADFRAVLLRLIMREGTQYSLANAIVADVGDTVAGACVAYDGASLAALRRPFVEAARAAWGMDHSHMPAETSPGELYVDSLAVLPEYRGRGVATALLREAKRRATREGLPLGLLVDLSNPRAEALYRSLGFHCVGTNAWGGHAMRHMVWS